MPKHQNKKPHKPSTISLKEEQFSLYQLINWWNRLSTRQRIILIACLILIVGSVFGVAVATMNNRRSTKTSSSSLKKQGFFKQPPEICRPLTVEPETTYRNKITAITRIENKEEGWRRAIEYVYEDNLTEKSDELRAYSVGELRHKLRELKVAVRKFVINEFQKLALQGRQIRLVRPEFMMGAQAMVEPSSGNILISVELDPVHYAVTLQNELCHVEIRYANLVKCGSQLPEEKIVILYPFINKDFSINPDLKFELDGLLKKCNNHVEEYLSLHSNGRILTDTQLATRNHIDSVLEQSYRTSFKNAFKQFIQTYAGRRSTIDFHTSLGGDNRRIMEQVSDMYEFPPAVRESFFKPLLEYLQKYYALSCQIESSPSP